MDEVTRHAAGPRVWEALCAEATEIVEIGANMGFYTIPGALAATATRASYRAYEPHPESAEMLRANLAENGIASVEVHEAAVVAGPARRVELAMPAIPDGATPGGATLVPDFSGGSVVEVSAVAMTDIVGSVDLIKLDVEGLEASLLEAAWDDFVRRRPVMMIEVHDVNRSLRSLLPALLEATGGRAYAMGRDSVVAVPVDALTVGPLFKRFGTWDYLLVPAGRQTFLRRLTIRPS